MFNYNYLYLIIQEYIHRTNFLLIFILFIYNFKGFMLIKYEINSVIQLIQTMRILVQLV